MPFWTVLKVLGPFDGDESEAARRGQQGTRYSLAIVLEIAHPPVLAAATRSNKAYCERSSTPLGWETHDPLLQSVLQ